jgi:hypothetical protein
VKKNNLTSGLFVALFLTSPLVGADQKYPASDFQPEIVFQDADYISKNSQSIEKHTSSSSSSVGALENDAVDSKYPAASFQPQVVYSDSEYKHSSSVSNDRSVRYDNVSNESNVGVGETNNKEKSSPNYLIGLVSLVAAGVFFSRKQFSACSKKTERNTLPVQDQGRQKLTGVTRYLNKASGTGVSRYVEKQVKSAAVTGVAKYMAKQVTATKATAIQAATGVEKYMRNRG